MKAEAKEQLRLAREEQKNAVNAKINETIAGQSVVMHDGGLEATYVESEVDPTVAE